jgi:cobalt-zinc-cadmium efflux system membrane fusion protein
VNARVLFSIAAVAVLMTLVGRPLAAEAQADAHAAISPASRPYASPNVLRIAATSRARRELVLAPVKRKAVTTEIVATAIIEPNAGAVAQVTSEIPARVVKLIAPLGQNVRPGEPLAILSSVELGQAKTEYLRVRSLESITRQHLAREESLYARKITPMKDLLEARAQHDAALAEYKAARERLRLLIPASQINKLQWGDDRAGWPSADRGGESRSSLGDGQHLRTQSRQLEDRRPSQRYRRCVRRQGFSWSDYLYQR